MLCDSSEIPLLLLMDETMAKRSPLSKQDVQSSLSYDPETGILTWKTNVAKNVKQGSIAGCVVKKQNGKCYIRVSVRGHLVYAHRLVYLLMMGTWPKHLIDHKNGNGTDNRWDNLQPATHSQNQKNRRLPINNTTGHMNIHRTKNGKFKVYVSVDGKPTSFGAHCSLSTAIEVRNKALALHGYSTQHGKERNL